MTTRIQLRRDTAVRWASVNPVLAAGEPAVESDTGKLKVGDGVSVWSALPYILDVADLTPIIEQLVVNSIPPGMSSEQVRDIIGATVVGDGDFIVVDADDPGEVVRLQPGASLTEGLDAKQDAATLAADVAPHVSDGSALDVALRAASVAAVAASGDFPQLVNGKVPSTQLPGFTARVSDLTTPIVIAHQGGANLAPSNTMEAYRTALGYGAKVLDADANLLADGALGLLHDSTLTASTTSTGNVSDQTAASWQQLTVDAGTWFGANWGNLRPALASQFLAEFGNRVVVSMEAKTPGAAAVALAREINRFGVAESVIAATAFWADIPTLVATGAHVQYVMTTGTEKTPAEVAAAGVDSVGCDWTAVALTSSLVAAFHAAGVKVFGYTINRQVEAAAFLAKGGDGWYSDDPVYSAGAYDGYSYRLPKMPFGSQSYYHGHIQGTSASPRGVFSAPDGFGWADLTNAGARTVLAGGISPIKGDPNANTFTLDISNRLVSQVDAGRFVGVFIGENTDAGFPDNGSGAGANGYRCLINGAGALQVAKYTDGVQQAGSVTTPGTALTYPSTLTWRVIVTPTAITLTRTDVATTMTFTDSTHRGGYVHMEMSGTTGYFTRLEVTA